MALETPGVAQGNGVLGSLASRVAGGAGAKHARVGGHGSRFEDVYLTQLIPAALLVLYGVVVIWSASLNIADASFPRHILGILVGAVCGTLMWRYDYRSLQNITTALLVLDAVLMILPKVPGLGYAAKGMTGWVQIPIVHFRFQPSEFAKIVTIFLMASECAQFNGKIDNFRDYVRVCGTLCVPFGLIMLVPDLGTGLIILVMGATVIICAGAKRSWVLATIAIIVAGAALVVVTSTMDGVPHILKEYQLKRLMVFMDPSVDPTGDGYNLQQAKIAVGSGGFLGKGIANATQSGSGFLPEAHTDFVFALLSEEFGFLGDVVLLLLFAATMFSTILLALRVEGMFSKLLLVGCVAMWGFQLLENVGMCIGMMPITGIPLPFISYGGSSMVTQLTAVGIVQSVWRHRKKSG